MSHATQARHRNEIGFALLLATDAPMAARLQVICTQLLVAMAPKCQREKRWGVDENRNEVSSIVSAALSIKCPRCGSHAEDEQKQNTQSRTMH